MLSAGHGKEGSYCAYEQAGPGLGSRGSGLRRQRHWQWAAVGATVLLGQRAGHSDTSQGSGESRAWALLGQGTNGRKQGRAREAQGRGPGLGAGNWNEDEWFPPPPPPPPFYKSVGQLKGLQRPKSHQCQFRYFSEILAGTGLHL